MEGGEVVAGALGWILGIATNWLTMWFTKRSDRRDLARLLVLEVEFNLRRAKLFGRLHAQVAAGAGITDQHCNPVPLDLGQARQLPGTFATTAFDATLEKHGYLDYQVLSPLHSFYRLLRQAEQFRDAAASDVTPPQRAGFIRDMLESGANAAKGAEEARLVECLKELGAWTGRGSPLDQVEGPVRTT